MKSKFFFGALLALLGVLPAIGFANDDDVIQGGGIARDHMWTPAPTPKPPPTPQPAPASPVVVNNTANPTATAGAQAGAQAGATGVGIGGNASVGNISPQQTANLSTGPTANNSSAYGGQNTGTFNNASRTGDVRATLNGGDNRATVGNVGGGSVGNVAGGSVGNVSGGAGGSVNNTSNVAVEGSKMNIGPVGSTSGSTSSSRVKDSGNSDVKVDAKGGTSSSTTGAMSQNQTTAATNEGVRASGNLTDIHYDAARIPVASAAPVFLPPVVCASSSSGLGVQTQVFGFNFGRADSRQECWDSKEATECVNMAVAVVNSFGMRSKMAIVAVGCTVQSPTFIKFGKTMNQSPTELAKEILASYQEDEASRAKLAQAERDRTALENSRVAFATLTSESAAANARVEEMRIRAVTAEAQLLDQVSAQEKKAASPKRVVRTQPAKVDCDKVCKQQK